MPTLAALARHHAATASARTDAAFDALDAAQKVADEARYLWLVAEAAAYVARSPARIARLRVLVARGADPGPAESVDRDAHRAHGELVRYIPATDAYRRLDGERVPGEPAKSFPGPLAADVLALIDRLAREPIP